MNGENINIGNRPLRVLISPLDWGLGHATRIITIVKTLQKYDVEVLIAAEGAAAALLQSEFPSIEILPLAGYRVRYSRNKKNFNFKLLQQIPAIYRHIKQENRWLKKAASEYKIDAIISDNRFGFYHRSLPSVYITHQLFIETGKKWMNTLAQKIHYKYIHKFSECWVPDFNDGITLAGKLSHPEKLPGIPVRYIGPLSRFEGEGKNSTDGLLIILSGPEPQRTMWEEKLLQEAKSIDHKIILVRGLPGSNDGVASTQNMTVYNHLPAQKLEQLIKNSRTVLSRCGYSTVMDLVALSKDAVLVPTPGQAEQEYLAIYLRDSRLFHTCAQQELQLKNLFPPGEDHTQKYRVPDFKETNESMIKEWLTTLRVAK